VTATLEAPADAGGASDDVTDTDTAPPVLRPVPPALQAWHDPSPWLGRVLTLVVALAAGLTRFWALGSPPGLNHVPTNGMNFDEIYYATEAQELLRYGYEDNRGFMFIVHPPVGKWLIAAGEWIEGVFSGSHSSTAYLSNSLGWRIMPAFFGCLGVVMIMRIARRMFRSNLFGFVAGALMTMEGMSLVLARTAILDIFLQTFVIAAFGAMVLDRDTVRERLAHLVAAGADLSAGVPTLGPRPWRVIAGVMLGLACGVKWTGVFFFVAFAILCVFWDRAAFKAAGAHRPMRPWLRRSVLPALGSLAATPLLTYLFCYLGWFAGENSWNRYGETSFTSYSLFHIPLHWGWLPAPLKWLVTYHADAYNFHKGLDSPHTYQSNPWSWLVLGRPVDFYYNGSQTTCGASSCSREILLIGTPLMWWAFVPMLLWLAWHWFTTRDWRAGAVWVAFIAGWVVWFQDLKRTMFLFYMAPLVPFFVLGLTLALGTLLGPAPERDRHDPHPLTEADLHARRRRTWGAAVVGGYLGLVVIDFAWMWPLFTGGLLTTDQWHWRMWLPSWV